MRMTIDYAKKLVGTQERNIRKVDNVRIEYEGYEYRITYRGGFAAYVGIDRKQIGKRNFLFFGGVGAYDCWTAGQVLDKVYDLILKKTQS